MNKKNNRKGFTIVELVIVIAVIAILATVMVPTFGDVITKANKTSAIQEARNELTEYFIDNASAMGSLDAVIKCGDYYFAVIDGNIEMETNAAGEEAVKIYEKEADAKKAVEDSDATNTLTWDTLKDGINAPKTTTPVENEDDGE